jgi:tetratricopeptide (TPR) repeat protein
MFLKCSLAWQKENESFHPSSDCVRALKCFEILESSPESTPEELLLAQWLAGVRTASDTFSFSKREKPAKAAELLEKVLEPLKSAGPAYYMHYGLALFGLADSLTYLGEMETAFAKYKEGYRVLQKAFNKDSDTLMFYKSQMKALHLI